MEGVSHDFGSSTQTSGSKSRTTASSVLWGHLLTKGSSASSIQRTSQGSSASSLAPISPMDKAGTSLRVLLHDTQATLEKFSSRVDALTGGVDQSRREIMTVQKLFQQDRERMVDETVDLVNRCQREIQKAVGSPAQVSRVDEIHAELVAVDRRLETLDKRIDMLQMLAQTQSQLLQTIQDQHGKLISALTPLLPLLQAVPVHIENAKNQVKESIREAQKSIGAAPTVLHTRVPHVPSDASHVVSSSASVAPSSPDLSAIPETSRKKRKLITPELTSCTSISPIPTIGLQTHLVGPAFPGRNAASQLSVTGLSEYQLGAVVPSVSHQGSRPIHQTPLRTPQRLPFTDVPLLSNAAQTPVAHSASRQKRQKISGADPRTYKTPSHRNASPASSAVSDPARNAAYLRAQETPKNISITSSTSTLSQSSFLQNAQHPSLDKNPTDWGEKSSSSITGIRAHTDSSSPLSSLTGSHVAATPRSARWVQSPSRGSPTTRIGRLLTHQTPRDVHKSADPLGLRNEGMPVTLVATHVTPAALSANATPASGKAMTIKDRRALLDLPSAAKEGKRFIPLDDDEDADLILE